MGEPTSAGDALKLEAIENNFQDGFDLVPWYSFKRVLPLVGGTEFVLWLMIRSLRYKDRRSVDVPGVKSLYEWVGKSQIWRLFPVGDSQGSKSSRSRASRFISRKREAMTTLFPSVHQMPSGGIRLALDLFPLHPEDRNRLTKMDGWADRLSENAKLEVIAAIEKYLSNGYEQHEHKEGDLVFSPYLVYTASASGEVLTLLVDSDIGGRPLDVDSATPLKRSLKIIEVIKDFIKTNRLRPKSVGWEISDC